MPRELTQTTLDAIYAQSTAEVFVELVTINHADLAAPIRLCNNNEIVTSRGNDFLPFPFLARIPPSVEGESPRAQMVFDNVSLELIDEIRSITTPPTVDLELIVASQPDTVEAGPWSFTMKGATYDQFTIEIELSYEDLLQEPFPHYRFTPLLFPALFKQVERA